MIHIFSGGSVNTDGSDQEFLRAIHEEKINAQRERMSYVTKKLAFVTVLFGLSSINLDVFQAGKTITPLISELYWLLYLVPLASICFDSYIMSADTRVKRIGAFLGGHPGSMAGNVEKQWEIFSAVYRSPFAPFTDMFLSVVVTVAAASCLNIQQHPGEGGLTGLLFSLWLVLSLAILAGLWFKHRKLLREIDAFDPDTPSIRT